MLNFAAWEHLHQIASAFSLCCGATTHRRVEHKRGVGMQFYTNNSRWKTIDHPYITKGAAVMKSPSKEELRLEDLDSCNFVVVVWPSHHLCSIFEFDFG